jgi:hypothetical protein
MTTEHDTTTSAVRSAESVPARGKGLLAVMGQLVMAPPRAGPCDCLVGAGVIVSPYEVQSLWRSSDNNDVICRFLGTVGREACRPGGDASQERRDDMVREPRHLVERPFSGDHH